MPLKFKTDTLVPRQKCLTHMHFTVILCYQKSHIQNTCVIVEREVQNKEKNTNNIYFLVPSFRSLNVSAFRILVNILD